MSRNGPLATHLLPLNANEGFSYLPIPQEETKLRCSFGRAGHIPTDAAPSASTFNLSSPSTSQSNADNGSSHQSQTAKSDSDDAPPRPPPSLDVDGRAVSYPLLPEPHEDAHGTVAALRAVRAQVLKRHRDDLAMYATSAGTCEMPFTKYCGALAAALDDQLGVSSSRASEESYPMWDQLPEAPRDPLGPWFLPEHQAALRPPRATTVSWVRSLPTLSSGSPLTLPAQLVYTAEDVDHVLAQLRAWATNVVGTLRAAGTPAKAFSVPATPSAEHLTQAVEALHMKGAEPHVVADEMIAVALCTIELPLTAVVALPLLHGPNRSIYAVMNRVCRLSRCDTAPVSHLPVSGPRASESPWPPRCGCSHRSSCASTLY